jgi:hypothetical protein
MNTQQQKTQNKQHRITQQRKQLMYSTVCGKFWAEHPFEKLLLTWAQNGTVGFKKKELTTCKKNICAE